MKAKEELYCLSMKKCYFNTRLSTFKNCRMFYSSIRLATPFTRPSMMIKCWSPMCSPIHLVTTMAKFMIWFSCMYWANDGPFHARYHYDSIFFCIFFCPHWRHRDRCILFIEILDLIHRSHFGCSCVEFRYIFSYGFGFFVTMSIVQSRPDEFAEQLH